MDFISENIETTAETLGSPVWPCPKLKARLIIRALIFSSFYQGIIHCDWKTVVDPRRLTILLWLCIRANEA